MIFCIVQKQLCALHCEVAHIQRSILGKLKKSFGKSELISFIIMSFSNNAFRILITIYSDISCNASLGLNEAYHPFHCCNDGTNQSTKLESINQSINPALCCPLPSHKMYAQGQSICVSMFHKYCQSRSFNKKIC